MRNLIEIKVRKLIEINVRELTWVVVNQTTNQNSHHFRTLNGHDKSMSAYQLVGPSSATAQPSQIGMIGY